MSVFSKARVKLGSWLLKPELKQRGKMLPFVPNWMSGKPIWTDWSADRAIKHGLKASVWVYRCIQRRAKAMASVSWYVEERQGDKWVRKPNHPLEVLLAEPNPFMSGQQLMEYLVNHLDLGGNGLWHMVTARKMPVELWPIKPDPTIIKPVPDRQKFISHYEYTIEPGNKIRLEPKEIIHFRFVDPGNLYWGLAPLQVAAITVDTDVEAVRWNKIALQNRAVTDGVFTFEHPLTEEQWEEARKQVREQHQGADNARTPWVLGAGAKWYQMSLTPVEMDFLNSRKFSREEICAVFDVPPILVGATEASTYNNYQTSRLAFWEDTIIPLLDSIRECLDMALIPYWDPEAAKPGVQAKLRIMYDLSTVPAMQDKFSAKVDAATKLWRMGVPLNMINEHLELGLPEVPGGDEPRLSGGFYLASGSGPTSKKDNADSWTEEQKAQFWKARDATRRAWEKKVAALIAERFEEEADLAARAYEEGGEVGVRSFVDDQATEWQGLLAAIYTGVIEHFGQIEGERIAAAVNAGKGAAGPGEVKFQFDPYAQLVRAFILNQAARKVALMTESTKELIAKEIGEGLMFNESVVDIGKRIRALYLNWAGVGDTEIGFPRAMRIARTEVGAAAGYGNYYGAVQAETEFGVKVEKEWISSRDERVRESHWDVDGERRPLNEPYSNGLMYPGDAKGPADEVIMCRCVQAHHVVG